MLDFDASGALISTDLPFPVRRGKVRDCYDLGDQLAIISTDRISAFDYVLPVGIPDKGRILTALSRFWFEFLDVPNHLLSTTVPDVLQVSEQVTDELSGRTMIVRKAQVIPFECVVRGYLEGSGWREYQATGSVCGIRLPENLIQCDRLALPLFTPATKATTGHDENVSIDVMTRSVGRDLTEQLQKTSISIYQRALSHAMSCGLIIADTKFEFGLENDRLILIDEVLTPDSSRFWPADEYEPGHPQKSYDKQFVREWLMASTWDRNSPPPPLPQEIIDKTRAKYLEAAELLSGSNIL